MRMRLALAAALLLAGGGAQAGGAPPRLNAMHILGSHNSYRPALDDASLAALRAALGERSRGVEYGHPPIDRQLDLGLRQLEFDPYADSQGGRFAEPYLADPKKAAIMRRPGAKVLHIPVVDNRTHCLALADCFSAVAAWSGRHPGHDLLVIFVNTKDDGVDPRLPQPEPYTEASLADIDRSAIAVFGRGRLLTPDDVRGAAPSLRAAVVAQAWPSQDAVRGKVLLVLDSTPRVAELYRQAHSSLKGRVMFGLYDEAAPEAAVFNIQDPKAEEARIRRLVDAGFLVRTRSDADTAEARAGDQSRLAAALRSGAQIISTDYYPGAPDPLGLGFVIKLPDPVR